MLLHHLRYFFAALMLLPVLAYGETVYLHKSNDATTPLESGKTFFYTIKYSCESTTVDCFDVDIDDALSDDLRLVKVFSPSDATFSTTGSDYNAKTLKWHFGQIAAGTTGEIRYKVEVRPGAVADGSTISNVALPTRNVGTTPITDPSSNTDTLAVTAIAQWSVAKVAEPFDPFHSGFYLDTDITYTLSLCPDTTIGNLNINDVTITDTYPAGATVVNSGSGTVDTAAHTVTWSALSADVTAGCLSKTVVLRYETPTFSDTQSVTNSVEVTGTPLGGVNGTIGSAAITDTLEPFVFNPTPRMTLSKGATVPTNSNLDWIRDDDLGTNHTITYTLNPRSTGNVPLTNVSMRDMFPTNEMEILSVTTGVYNAPGDVNISYQTSANPNWTFKGTYSRSSSVTLANTDFGSVTTGGEYITAIRFDFGDVPVDFEATTPPTVSGSVFHTFRDGTTPNEGDINTLIHNCAQLNADDNATVPQALTEVESCKDVEIRDNYAVPKALKSISSNELSLDEVFTYTIDVTNSTDGTGSLTDPIVFDLLPRGIEYISTSYNNNGHTGVTQVLSVENGSGVDSDRTLLRWNFTGTLQRGEFVTLDITVKVLNIAGNGILTNNAYITTQDTTVPFSCNVLNGEQDSTLDITDATLLSYTNTSPTVAKVCEQSNSATIINVAKIVSEKWVKGAYDTAWSRFPASGRTYAGGSADYNLTIRNGGNVAVSNLEIIDILPFVGDTGVKDTAARNSQWRTNLAEPISTSLGDVYYSLATNPCRAPDYLASDAPECQPPNWSLTPPGDITQVRSIKIVFDPAVVIQPDESRSFSWKMQAPVDTPPAAVAWNSFAFKGDREDGSALLAAEPLKVGIEVNAEQQNSYGDTVWLDINQDGLQDAGEPGINGVKVELFDASNDTLIATTYTATDINGNLGKYRFSDIPDGSYYAVFTIIDGFIASPPNSGTDDTLDSDAETALGGLRYQTASTVLGSPESDLSWDMGIYPDATHAAVGDYVWRDQSAYDGVQDASPVADMIVELHTADGTLVDSTATSVSGKYLFYRNVNPDTQYYIEFITPYGSGMTYADQGGDDALDSDAGINKRTPLFTISANSQAPGEDPDFDGNTLNNVNLSVDGGIVTSATLGNYVWLDRYAEGIQDSNEVGISGVTVTLINETTGNTVAGTAITDADGKYLFEDLTPGDYHVEFDWSAVDYALHPYRISPSLQGGDTTLDSNGGIVSGNTQQATTPTITLNEGDNDLTWDLGLYRLVSLGDLVWLDANGNGIQESEAGVSGIEVELYQGGVRVLNDADGNAFGTVVTDANGNYLFDNLPPNAYQVKFILPVGSPYVFTRPRYKGILAQDDSDANAFGTNDGMSSSVSLNSNFGNGYPYLDAGVFIPASIGDFVWHDINANGIQDAGEPVISGAQVSINNIGFDNLDVDGVALDPLVTDTNGNYLFDRLFPGTYELSFTLPSGYMWTYSMQGSDITLDSNAPATVTETLVSGEDNRTVDAGVIQPAALSDYVWLDANRNGIQEAGESGIGGIAIDLLDENGTTIATQTTNAAGAYRFANLFPGTYSLRITLPDDLYPTLKDATDDASDSDLDPVTLTTIPTLLSEGEDDTSWDIGLFGVSSIGDRVWLDSNADGIQDSGENGLGGITVTLLDSNNNSVTDASGNSVGAQSTAADGTYRFEQLLPGDYKVCFDTTGYEISLKDNTATDDTLDSDISLNAPHCSDVETLTAQETNLNYDLGLYINAAALGDRVWIDANQNGLQDAGETGLGGITVNLLDDLGNILATDTTDANGAYLFSDLKPDFYEVEFNLSSLPQGYVVTEANNGNDDALDSDADRQSGKTGTFQILSGDNTLVYDMGVFELGSLGDTVWYDTDRNGIQDAGESGIVGISVRLLDSSGNPVLDSNGNAMVTTTDANGTYLFENLYAGDYIVEIVTPFGYVVTPQNSGSDDTIDSDIDPTTKRTAPITIGSGTHDLRHDAGLYIPYASLGDRVWNDHNANGIQEGGEDGVANVKVELYSSSYVSGDTNTSASYLGSTVTDSSGHYHFANLIPDSYVIKFLPPAGYHITPDNTGSDDMIDSDADTTGIVMIPTLSADVDDTRWDLGIYLNAKIGDRVWIDSNGNGIQESGESGLDGVDVTLTRQSDQITLTTTTANGGAYLFENLQPESYTLSFVLPSGYEATQADVGNDDTLDSDAGASLITVATVLDSNESDMSWDLGVIERASIGDTVWRDDNRDGIDDGSEPRVSGIIVNLLDSGENIVASTTTDTNGHYEFTNLLPAAYIVEFNLSSLPTHFVPTLHNQGGDDATDSDANPSTGRTDTINLLSGEQNITIDMGINIPQTSLGDRVWNDTNLNGRQDSDELGVEGVRVTLLDSNGNSVIDATGATVNSVLTNSSGNYYFSNLVPGDYMVEFEQPSGYGVTVANNGNDNEDSDVNPATMRTPLISLTAQEQDTSVDMGLYQLASLGDTVWNDSNRNGLQDAGEIGVADITVNLLDINGTLLQTTTTDTNGLYRFEALEPTAYRVAFDLTTLPTYFEVTPKDIGLNNDANDSDADTTTGISHLIHLNGGEHDETIDMGIYLPSTSIGDFVWNDNNGDGIQDSNESGVANVTATLLDDSGTVIATTVTDSTGHYEFDNLYPGTYAVQFSLPSGYTLSPSNSGDDARDSDVDAQTLTTPLTSIDAGAHETTLDMGIYALSSIGDTIWHDDNGDGIIDVAETRFSGVEVLLLDPFGTTVATAVTDANGNYLFENIPQGSYVVQVNEATLPSGNWASTTMNVPMSVMLPPATNFLDADFGYDNDSDSDGIADSVEAPPYVDPDTGMTVTPPSTVIDANHDGRDDTTGIPTQRIDADHDGIPNYLDTDSDGDGIPDADETGDHDGDGIPDYLDYDPQGYFYDVDDGTIIAGGGIEVTCDNAQTPVIVKDGSDGQYQWYIPGLSATTTCTMTYSIPPRYELDTVCSESTGPLDPTGQPNPYYIGSSQYGSTGKLADFSCSANPWYATFVLEPGDPEIMTNNIPIKKRPVTVPTLSEWGRMFMMLLMFASAYIMLQRSTRRALP